MAKLRRSANPTPLEDVYALQRFAVPRKPDGLGELCDFGLWAIDNVLARRDVSPPTFWDAYFMFADAYDGGLDLVAPSTDGDAQESEWVHRLACFANAVQAQSIVVIQTAWLDGIRVDYSDKSPTPDARAVLTMKVVTAGGEQAFVVVPYTLDADNNLVVLDPVRHPFSHDAWRYSDVFTLRSYGRAAEAYARRMLREFPPDRPSAARVPLH